MTSMVEPANCDKPLSRKWPIAGSGLSIAGLAGMLWWPLVTLGLIGLATGVRSILARAPVMSIRVASGVTLGLSIACLSATGLQHWRWFHAEAPADAIRLDFDALTTKQLRLTELRTHIGQRVCLKGYIYPTHEQEFSSFLLSPNGAARDRYRYSGAVLPIGSTFHWTAGPVAVTGVLSELPSRGELEPMWILRDCEVREAKSPWQLARYRGSACYYPKDE